MADRWSEPSGPIGIDRFRVWPLGTDQYDHAEHAANWDKLDAILGHPASGTWPAQTGVGGGIYREVKLAKDAAVPLGVVFPFYKPHISVALPAGAVACDGATYTTPDHDFPGLTNVTVPDLRNAFVLGADFGKDIGAAAAEAGTAASMTSDGAPGPQGAGGSNTVALAEAEMPTHAHEGSYTGWSPVVFQWYAQNSTYDAMKNAPQYLDTRDEAIERCGLPGCYYEPERTQPKYPASENFEYENWGAGTAQFTGAGGWGHGQHRHNVTSLSTEGSSAAHENRPRYVGLIYLVKIKVAA